MDFCKACGSGDLREFWEARVPIFQNIRYEKFEDAKNCTLGELKLKWCESCGMLHNYGFEEALADYGESYENSQFNSQSYLAYIDEIIAILRDKYGVRGANIAEIGCGNGKFLELLCAATNSRGVGFDPSFRGENFRAQNAEIHGGGGASLESKIRREKSPEDSSKTRLNRYQISPKITIFKEYFTSQNIPPNIDLIACRHVIEHIKDPLGLLKNLNAQIWENLAANPTGESSPQAPRFASQDSRRFDATAKNLAAKLAQGFADSLQDSARGFATLSPDSPRHFAAFPKNPAQNPPQDSPNDSPQNSPAPAKNPPLVFFETPRLEWILSQGAFYDFFYEHVNYFSRASLEILFARAGFRVLEILPAFEGQYCLIFALPTPPPNRESYAGFAQNCQISALKERLKSYKCPVIWGSGAKGVTLANLISGFACIIDINPNKAHCFAPKSALEVLPPTEAFARLPIDYILVMNPNYLAEITATVREITAGHSKTPVIECVV